VRRLDLTEIARAAQVDTALFTKIWGSDRTVRYMAALRDTMKGSLQGLSSAAIART
jgi:hypothetical protein